MRIPVNPWLRRSDRQAHTVRGTGERCLSISIDGAYCAWVPCSPMSAGITVAWTEVPTVIQRVIIDQLAS
jgi:hypothetical protein